MGLSKWNVVFASLWTVSLFVTMTSSTKITLTYSPKDKIAGTTARMLSMIWMSTSLVEIYDPNDRSILSIKDVRESNVVVLLLTKETIRSGVSMLATYWAVKYAIPLMTVQVNGGDFSFSESKRLTQELDDATCDEIPDVCNVFETHGVDLLDAAWRLGTTIPYVVAVPFDPTGERGAENPSNRAVDLLKVAFATPPSSPGLPSAQDFRKWQTRLAHNETPPSMPPPSMPWRQDDRHFDAYLSHHISESGAAGRLLKMRLLKLANRSDIFLDVDDMIDLRAEATNVAQSRSFALLATAEYFTRPYCLLEAWTALRRSDRPFVLVNVAGGSYDPNATVTFLSELSTRTLEASNPGASRILHENGLSVSDVRGVLYSALVVNGTMIPSYEFDSAASELLQSSQVRRIGKVLGLIV